MVKQNCPNCEKDWFYAGESKYITCPNCFHNWTLSVDEIEVHLNQIGKFGIVEEMTRDEIGKIENEELRITISQIWDGNL